MVVVIIVVVAVGTVAVVVVVAAVLLACGSVRRASPLKLDPAFPLLPWLVIASRQSSMRRRVTLTSATVLVAGLTPWGAVLAGTSAVLLAVLRRRDPGEVVLQTAVTLTIWLPGLVPALAGSPGAADPDGARAFRLADDIGVGVFPSALVGGGVWSDAATLPARAGLLGVVGLLVVLILGVLGFVELRRGSPHAALAMVVTAVGVPLIGALLSGPLLAWWTNMQQIPGLALLRDLHRVLAPSVVATVLLAAVGMSALLRRASGGHRSLEVPVAVIVPAAVALILVPGAPDRVRAAYEPRPFSPEWEAVATAVDSGRVLSLPWQPLRRVAWMPQTFLDPTAKAVPGRVLSDGTLTIERDGGLIRVADSADVGAGVDDVADDTLRRWLSLGLDDPLPSEFLSGSGIEHIVVWKGSPGSVPDIPPTWTTTFFGADFAVWSGPSAVSR